VAVVALGAAGSALAVSKTPDFPAPPDDRLQHAGDDALAVDIYRMTDVAEQKTYFRMDLGQRGVQPVWIRITNKTSASRYIVQADDVVITKGDAELARAERARSSVSTAQAETNEVLVAALLPAPLLFVAAAQLSETSEARRNLAEKQLYSHTLGPGQSASGFVYVKTPNGAGDLAGYELRLRIRPLAAGDTDKLYRAAF
jgi:hypothetical protein